MSQKRNRLEILKDILLVVFESKDGVKKTKIMQGAYLDWRNFKRYFDFLIENDFLDVTVNKTANNTDRIYIITDKGKELLVKLVELDNFINGKKEG
ncbi:MAG: hypothetical protein J7K36_03375 [Archaeoglobaceae archaeon]|nr:hypothetical protein [Archaeoglobaceae archaeon]